MLCLRDILLLWQSALSGEYLLLRQSTLSGGILLLWQSALSRGHFTTVAECSV